VRENFLRHGQPGARFPCLKTLDQFDWNWPKKINRTQVQNLFRLAFFKDKTNVIFLGGVGLGKTHLASALGYAACQQRHSVLFVSAVEVVNTLPAAQAAHTLPAQLRRFTRPRNSSGRRCPENKKEKICGAAGKKTPPEEDGISNRRFHATFRTPLTKNGESA
jgi:hypothetical protein